MPDVAELNAGIQVAFDNLVEMIRRKRPLQGEIVIDAMREQIKMALKAPSRNGAPRGRIVTKAPEAPAAVIDLRYRNAR